jgi:hypothetical protein
MRLKFVAGQKIIKALKLELWTDIALTLYLWSNPLMFKVQCIVGLCKSLTVNTINFLKVGNS